MDALICCLNTNAFTTLFSRLFLVHLPRKSSLERAFPTETILSNAAQELILLVLLYLYGLYKYSGFIFCKNERIIITELFLSKEYTESIYFTFQKLILEELVSSSSC